MTARRSRDPRHRRSHARAAALLGALFGGATAACGGGGGSGPVVVTSVVDGDTIEVLVGGQEESVRLLGVDTPETKDPASPVMCFGPEASQHLAELLPVGTEVELQVDVERRDRYGRLLAYVYRGDMFVNLDLVSGGWADVLSYEPNTTHAAALQGARDAAKAQGLGLWAACGAVDVPLEPALADVGEADGPGG